MKLKTVKQYRKSIKEVGPLFKINKIDKALAIPA